MFMFFGGVVLTVISLGKSPIIWDLRTLVPVLPQYYAAAWRKEKKKKSRPFMVIRSQSPVINQTDRDTIEILYEFQPPRTIENIIEWILIPCSTAQWSTTRKEVGCYFGWPELFACACFIYFPFNTGMGQISKHSRVNSAGNRRGYFDILL